MNCKTAKIIRKYSRVLGIEEPSKIRSMKKRWIKSNKKARSTERKIMKENLKKVTIPQTEQV